MVKRMAVCVVQREVVKGDRVMYFHRIWAFMSFHSMPKQGSGCDKSDV